LWAAINHKYLLYYDKLEKDKYLQKEITGLFSNGVFVDIYMQSTREIIDTDLSEGNVKVLESSGVQYKVEKPIAYNDFLKRINRQTNIPISLLHAALVENSKKSSIDQKKINEESVARFVTVFNEWKNRNLQGRFKYQKSNLKLSSTALTYSNGSPKSEITQGRIGTQYSDQEPIDKYLYDTFVYDSQLEKDNIQANIEQVVVFGKIPRHSIAIPTISGGSYSPDFMYVVKKKNGDKSLNIVVETKDVENQTDLRGVEEMNIKCAEEFFKHLTLDGYKVEFHTQLNKKKMAQIIREVMDKEEQED